jgi:hypothetical protein
MSRRCHHGSPRHSRPVARERQRAPGASERPVTPAPEHAIDAAVERSVENVSSSPLPMAPVEPEVVSDAHVAEARTPVAVIDPTAFDRVPGRASGPRDSPGNGFGPPGIDSNGDGFDHGATAPQLRRFIKSRAYVPMHELRRRFGINGGDDEVTPVDLEADRVFVGLPPREGRLLGELLRAGDIGYELSLDPITPIVVGVYPMRPVPRG